MATVRVKILSNLKYLISGPNLNMLQPGPTSTMDLTHCLNGRTIPNLFNLPKQGMSSSMVKHTHGAPRSVESPNVPIEMAENHEYIYVYIYIYDYMIK